VLPVKLIERVALARLCAADEIGNARSSCMFRLFRANGSRLLVVRAPCVRCYDAARPGMV